MTALTQTLYRESPGTWVMLTGYVLAVVASALFARECKASVRKDRAHADELAERDERNEALAARCRFLDTQNRNLFRRTHRSNHRRRIGCPRARDEAEAQ